MQIYESVRLPYANGVLQRSRENGRLYELSDTRFANVDFTGVEAAGIDGVDGKSQPEVEQAKPHSGSLKKLHELGEIVTDNWKWAWTTDAEGDRLRAIQMLEETFDARNAGEVNS